MPLGTNPDFVSVKNFFGGSNSFADYYRGGPYVPNISANAAISTTVAGLALNQFSGADKVTLPPAPTLMDASAGDYVQSSGGSMGANAIIFIKTNGYVYAYTDNQGSSNQYQWLPAGRAASEYQVRTSSDGVTWSGWTTITADFIACAAGANTDGFYSDYQSQTVYVQLGAQGTVLTSTATFFCDASANGRG